MAARAVGPAASPPPRPRTADGSAAVADDDGARSARAARTPCSPRATSAGSPGFVTQARLQREFRQRQAACAWEFSGSRQPSAAGAPESSSDSSRPAAQSGRLTPYDASVRRMHSRRAGRAAEASKAYSNKVGSSTPSQLLQSVLVSKCCREASCSPRYLTAARVRPVQLSLARDSADQESESLAAHSSREAEEEAEDSPAGLPPWPWLVVEVMNPAKIRMGHITSHDLREESVPRHSWLVLEVEPWQEVSGRLTAEESRRLQIPFDLHGSGCDLPEEASCKATVVEPMRVRPVPASRLTPAGVGANVQHVVLGKSAVALGHASLAMRLIGERLASEAQAGSPEVQEDLGRLAELEAYAKRMVPYIQSCAVCRRVQDQSANPKFGAASLIQDRQRLIRTGCRGFGIFRSFLQRRFGKPFRAWHMFVKSDRLSLGELEFYRACERVGFTPPAGVTLKDIWRYIDRDTSGLADFSDFNPSVAMELMRFRSWVEDFCGPGAPGIRRMIKKMDANKSGRISWKEFLERCQWHEFNASTQQLGRIFKHLDFSNSGSLAPEHIELLGTWEPPRYRLGEPNHKALGELKEMLFEKFCHSPLRAWRYGLDKDCSMRVCYKEFEAGARQILGEDTEFDLAGAWLALDQDSSGYLALEEFDQDAYNALVQFKTWCKERHRGVNRAWKMMDKEGTDRLTKKELQRACRLGVPSEIVAIVFDGLSRDKTLRLRHIRFLEHWDVEADKLTSEVLKKPATSRPPGHRAKLQRASEKAVSSNVWMRMFPSPQKPKQGLLAETPLQSHR